MNTPYIVLILALATACVSPGPRQDDPVARARIQKAAKNNSKKPTKDGQVAAKATKPTQTAAAAAPVLAPTTDELYGILLKPKLTVEEATLLSKPQSAKPEGQAPSNLEIANSVLAMLHRCLLEGENRPQAPLAPTDPAVTEAPKALACHLEADAQGQKIDLAAVLAANPHLQNPQSAALFLRVIALEPFSDSHSQELLLDALHATSRPWQALTAELDQKRAALAQVEAAGAPAVGPAVDPSKPLNYAPWEYHQDEALLAKADELIAQGRYEEVVQLLRKVDKSNVFYTAAQEKLIDACNQAAQRLRSQAAAAFQSAIPVADRRARMEYLTQAEEYLQKALTQFPEAEQSETIRQNLDVIQKNLQALSSGPRAE